MRAILWNLVGMTHPSSLCVLLISGLLIGTSSLGPSAAAADPLPEELLPLFECAKANLPKSSSVQTVEFRSEDRVGKGRKIKFRVYWKRFQDGLSKVVLKVSEPPDLRDTALLFIEKKDGPDMFIYLPDLKKVKRITTVMLSGSLFGSDLTYEDFMQLQGIGLGGRHELLDEREIGDPSLRAIAHYPAPESGSSYQRVVSYWDRESCMLVRSEMWEGGESPRKILTVDRSAIFVSGVTKLPQELKMTDVRDGTSTYLSIDEIEVDIEIPRKRFSSSNLGRR